eukprot:NODE_1182_length_1889_cov_0.492737.p3 type:complete len:104 gc:universal NODE_1182_length_1889_cov_0.492737:1386-1075(-)
MPVKPFAIEPVGKISKSKVDQLLSEYFKADLTKEVLTDLSQKLHKIFPEGYKTIIHVSRGDFHHYNVQVESKYLLDKNYDGYASISWISEEFVVLAVYWLYFE